MVRLWCPETNSVIWMISEFVGKHIALLEKQWLLELFYCLIWKWIYTCSAVHFLSCLCNIGWVRAVYKNKALHTHPFQLLSSSDLLKHSVNLLLDTPGPVHYPVDKHHRLIVRQHKLITKQTKQNKTKQNLFYLPRI